MSVRKTTLKDSPEASKVLTDIQPNEVSIVDMPANGEPFVVIKRGDTMTVKKLDSSVVPKSVMKNIADRLGHVIQTMATVQDIAKNIPVEEKDENQSPSVLVSVIKSAAAELRSLQSNTAVDVTKRAKATPVLSVQELIKREHDLEDVVKGNAISFLTRDQYVSVSSNITEYLTTFVDGIETDDSGPVLIPTDLNEVVDKSADELEKLVEDNPPFEEESEPDVQADISKLNQEIDNLKKALHDRSVTTEVQIDKKGSKMAAGRLNTLKSVSSGIKDAADQLENIVKELEDTEEESDMSDANVQKSTNEEAPESTGVQTTEKNESANAEEISNSALMSAFQKFFSEVTEKMSKLEGDVAKSLSSSEKVSAEVEKIYLARGDSRAGNDNSSHVEKKADNPASFAGLLGIKNV